MSLKAFKTRVLPAKDKLFRFALSITHNRAEAEDIVQEVLIRIWNRHQELNAIRNVEAWCMRLTKNLSIDKLRSKHHRTNPIDGALEVADDGASPLESTEAHDTIRLVRRIIAGLPEKQQQVMHLRDIEELSYQEIADILEMPLNQVKVNLHRARKAVRDQLLKMESYGKSRYS